MNIQTLPSQGAVIQWQTVPVDIPFISILGADAFQKTFGLDAWVFSGFMINTYKSTYQELIVPSNLENTPNKVLQL